MPLIPRPFIDEVLSRTDIVELIDARVPLRKTGMNYSARCPFHNEKTPSFSVSATKQFFHCFGCGKSGNAITFLMEHEHLDFVGAIETLAQQLGMEVPHSAAEDPHIALSRDLSVLLEKIAHYYHTQLLQHRGAQHYLTQRGLTQDMLKKFNIGFAPEGGGSLIKLFGNQHHLLTAGMIIKKDGGQYYDRFRHRVMFPIRNRSGKVIGFGGRLMGEGTPKYLNSPETPLFHKGKELYGLFEAAGALREQNALLVVEGYMDTVMLAQHGIPFVAATLGTATTPDHLHKLLRLTQDIIFCFDGDRAGRAAAWRALETSLPLITDGVKIRFLFLPEGEDPDSLVRKEGKEKFLQRLAASTPLTDVLFQQLSTGIDFASLEGRARLAKLAHQHIEKTPPGVFHHMLLERLAQLIRVDLDKLPGLLNPAPASPKRSTARAPMAKHKSVPLTPMRQAISLLLQHPRLIAQIPAGEVASLHELPGGHVLEELITLLNIQPSATTGSMLEQWRERKEHGLLLKLAALDLPFSSEEGVISQFKDILKRLKRLSQEQRIEKLMKKAQLSPLSLEEKQHLQTLIEENR